MSQLANSTFGFGRSTPPGVLVISGSTELGYLVEWRVVNAADYGFPQRRRRTFIVGQLWKRKSVPFNDALSWLVKLDSAGLARAFRLEKDI